MTTLCAQGQAPATKKHAVHHAAPAAPSITDQIQALKSELENQSRRIDTLTDGLAAKDAELRKAQEQEAAARAAAAKAESALASDQQQTSDNAAAVATLATTVQGLKQSQGALTESVTSQTKKIESAMNSPAVLRYKGVTFTPTGFFNGEVVWRSHATGADLPTPFNALPYEQSGSYGLSETFLSGRQSRLGLLTEGKFKWGTVRAYAEGDFLGVGTTSNNNQSNSYVFRQRMMMAEIETNSDGHFLAARDGRLQLKTRKAFRRQQQALRCPSRSIRTTLQVSYGRVPETSA